MQRAQSSLLIMAIFKLTDPSCNFIIKSQIIEDPLIRMVAFFPSYCRIYNVDGIEIECLFIDMELQRTRRFN